MRNALGLILASVVTAVLITGVWFWTSSPRADAAPPQTIPPRQAEPLPAPAAKRPTKGVFFPVGKHTTYHPEILRQVAAAGHTIGSHTWSHSHLDSKKLTEQQVREEIEKGFSAVKMALGAAPAPFFRFPALAHTQASRDYLGTRNIAMFSCDVDSNDFKSSGPDQVIQNVMTKLDKQGKGVILMHDLQKHTAIAL